MRFLLTCLVWMFVSRGVTAQQPKLGYVFPPVVKAGQTTEVQLGGYDFTSDMQFFVHDERLKVTASGAPGEFFVPEPPYWFGEKGFELYDRKNDPGEFTNLARDPRHAAQFAKLRSRLEAKRIEAGYDPTRYK